MNDEKATLTYTLKVTLNKGVKFAALSIALQVHFDNIAAGLKLQFPDLETELEVS